MPPQRATPWSTWVTADSAYGQDSRFRRFMATLRNLAINVLRHNGHTNIAASLRYTSYNPFTRPLDLLGIA